MWAAEKSWINGWVVSKFLSFLVTPLECCECLWSVFVDGRTFHCMDIVLFQRSNRFRGVATKWQAAEHALQRSARGQRRAFFATKCTHQKLNHQELHHRNWLTKRPLKIGPQRNRWGLAGASANGTSATSESACTSARAPYQGFDPQERPKARHVSTGLS